MKIEKTEENRRVWRNYDPAFRYGKKSSL